MEKARRRLAALFDVRRPNESALIRAREDYLRVRVNDFETNRFQLAMLWASQANTIPAAFWTIAFVLSDPEAAATIREEIDRVAGISERRSRWHRSATT
ncbi:MAG TPA: cytochrome P450 [Chloroflexota bacterium]|nr:cytochrome P450 [Chloroflexota bacterium]